MLYTLILLQFLHSMTVHRDLQINHTDNMFQLYYTESVKFCFKYTYASFHSSGLIVSLSGMMRSHFSLNSSVRKSSGMLKTPDSIATVRLCHVPVIALLAFDSCVIPSSRMNSALVFLSNKVEYSSWTSCLLRTMLNLVSEPA